MIFYEPARNDPGIYHHQHDTSYKVVRALAKEIEKMATAYEEQYDSSEYCTATSSEDESGDDNNVQYVTPRIFVNESAEKESASKFNFYRMKYM